MAGLFDFPDPVNETAARVVAGGVLSMATAAVVFDQPWLLVPLTYGFAARVVSGPTLSPLGQLATRVVAPRLSKEPKLSPGPPKRMAQGMGLAMSGTSLLLYYRFGRKRAAYRVLTALMAASGAEALFGYCLACRIFPFLVRAGLVPRRVCEQCADIGARPAAEKAVSTT